MTIDYNMQHLTADETIARRADTEDEANSRDDVTAIGASPHEFITIMI